jgi:CheY-like chemotaxis protein
MVDDDELSVRLVQRARGSWVLGRAPQTAWRRSPHRPASSDVIILDIMMPGMTGVEVLDRVKAAHASRPSRSSC